MPPPSHMEEVNLSDEDDTPLDQDEARKASQQRDWDLFQILPPDQDNDLVEDQICYQVIVKTLKVLAYIITFLVVLCGAVITKSTFLLMTSQLDKDRHVSYCRKTMPDRQFLAYTTIEERLSWTWAVYFAYILPEVQAFLRGLRIWVFKGQQKPTMMEFIVPFIFETLHALGMALLVFAVLPKLDVVKAVMLTNAVCLVPAILGLLSRGFDKYWVYKCVTDVFAIIFQLTALFVWPWFTEQQPSDRMWLLPIAAILVSCGWWENFVEITSPFDFIRRLGHLKKQLRSTRYVTYTIIPVWKMAIVLLGMLSCVWMNEGSFTVAFDKFGAAFEDHKVIVEEKRPTIEDYLNTDPGTGKEYLTPGKTQESTEYRSVQYAMIAQMVAAYLCYIFAKFTCKICIQAFSFAFPILLAVPVTIITLINLCGMREEEVCFWDNVMPGYLFWTCPKGDFWQDFFFGDQHGWAWMLWILSQTWVVIHVWNAKGIRLASTEKMFATPMYNSLLVDQSVALNRRRDEDVVEVDDDENEPKDAGFTKLTTTGDKKDPNKIQPKDTIPRIYACATMWHETREEMIEMLKSIFRMDADQCARRVALKYFEYRDPAYYEFETHIFFDDAFQLSDSTDFYSPMEINPFVRIFVGTLEEAASHVHQAFVKLRPPKKIPTPYGGRLEYILPGKTKLIVHIKDKAKIRHKKRWSQVMYMYYLLGHLLMEQPISTTRKEVIAENTFILALDGDIDFQPNAVELLVDLMKKNKHLGAACGRIHPIGSGPMVWYQKFEYAVGHWLQKATEHVFGHYVQFDQGEDRWLCTLMLQRGYRVEYCAASDAKTHAPEGFGEFYNQRRRWVPSTMANIMDLLLSYEKVVKVNPDISFLYICYQIVMMVGTILGPGTIFLMLVGAFATAFNLGQWTSFLYNFIPILTFILVCFLCKANIQLMVAQILSVIYALAMVAVVVAIALQVNDDGLFAPSSIFLIAVALSFIIAGIIHPLEFGCLPHGFLYYITIPSMYLLLMIYSLFNMNVVSWGTREGVKVKSKQELEAEKKEMEEMTKKKKKGLLFGLLPSQKDQADSEGSFELSFAGLFKVMCCVKEKPDETKAQLSRIAAALDKVSTRLDLMERTLESNGTPAPSLNSAIGRRLSIVNSSTGLHPIGEGDDEDDNADGDEDENPEHKIQRDDLMNPYWIEDKDLRKAEVDFLTQKEANKNRIFECFNLQITFWNELILKYLKPLDEDKKKQKEMAGALKDLKNNVSFAFLMINAVFVILVFLLQLEKESIHINWPFGSDTNVSYVPQSTEIHVSIEYLELEPIGLVFVGFFGIILVTQFIGMCLHRFGTLSHILAATDVAWCTRDTKTITKEAALQKHGVGLIRRLQHANSPQDEDDIAERKQSMTDLAGRRKTIANLEKQRFKKKEVDNLEMNFKRNFRSFAITADRRNSKAFSDDKAQATFALLKERRSTVLHRRSSVIDRRRSLFEDATASELSRANSITPSNNSSVGNENRRFKRNLGRTRSASFKGNQPEEIEMTDTYT
ncbi:Chitin synthase 1 [Folsomia candida]|uniref:chitin synthase n=1 Tax=Folsomia candida TaxID=158441 RepID=A0A226F566_FOLCA|nr:Chitin synthase 1 [Folsomia candida]